MEVKEQEKATNENSRAYKLLTIITLLAPAIYLIGLCFYQGRVYGYGVEADAFPISIQDAYVNAYFAIGRLLINLSHSIKEINFTHTYILIAFIVASLLIYLYLIRGVIAATPLCKYLGKKTYLLANHLHSKKSKPLVALGVTGIISYVVFSLLITLTALWIFWFGIPMTAYYQGKELTEKQINKYMTKGCISEENSRWSNCKRLRDKDGKVIYEGILIAHSNDMIAFLTCDGAFVQNFPSDGVVESILQTSIENNNPTSNYCEKYNEPSSKN